MIHTDGDGAKLNAFSGEISTHRLNVADLKAKMAHVRVGVRTQRPNRSAPLFNRALLVENFHEGCVACRKIISEGKSVVVLHRELYRETQHVAVERNHGVELISME